MEIKQLTQDSAQGERSYMEDFSLVDIRGGTILAVFDGHGGPEAAQLCVENLVHVLSQREGMLIEEALRDSLLALSNLLDELNVPSGTTASLVFIPKEGNKATVAVIGDSPVLIYGPEKDLWTGPDHNVRSNYLEAEAAKLRGGYIYNGYLCNSSGSGLQMGRALGNPHLKSILSREPEVFTVELEEGGWVLVATDGLFDPAHQDGNAMNNVAVSINYSKDVTAEMLVKRAIAAKTGDNVTAILARF